MGKTVKAEWSRPDGWHMTHRIERKARPAGRIAVIVDAELDLYDGDDEDDGPFFPPEPVTITFDPTPVVTTVRDILRGAA